MSIFRAYDIRGIVGNTLTTDIVKKIGQAIGSEAEKRQQKTIAVARDGRLSGPLLIEALIQGLQAAGRNIVNVGSVPTPVLYFATHHLNTHSGVMVTGSHNPPEYNGLKIMLAGDTLSGDAITSLKIRIDNNELIQGQTGKVENVDIQADYVNRITGDVKLTRPFKVVIDCGNGVAGQLAPRLIRALGCEVIELFCEVDGNFPNHHPDPSQPENLTDLIAAVQKEKADIGLAFDGDGDRLGVVDIQGKIIWPDRQMILYAQDILKRTPHAKIVYDVKCSRHLDNAIRENSGIPIMSRTGHSFIKAQIIDSQALLGGEMSGHIFFKERWYGFDDALYTAARLLEILSQDTRSPSQVFNALPDAVNTPELKLEMHHFGEHFELMHRIEELCTFENAVISRIDGIRADFKDGWGLVRPSNTTPCLVLRFEGDTEESLKRIQNQFRIELLKIDSTLVLPF